MDVFREMYYFELTRKDHLNTSLSLPIAIVAALCGAVAYLMQTVPPSLSDYWTGSYSVLLILLTVFVLLAAYYLFRSRYGYPYEYVSTAKEIAEHIGKVPTNAPQGRKMSRRESVENITAKLTEQYATCVNTNVKNNDERSKRMHKAVTHIGIALALFVGTTIPFIKIYHEMPKIQRIQVVPYGLGGKSHGREQVEAGGSLKKEPEREEGKGTEDEAGEGEQGGRKGTEDEAGGV